MYTPWGEPSDAWTYIEQSSTERCIETERQNERYVGTWKERSASLCRPTDVSACAKCTRYQSSLHPGVRRQPPLHVSRRDSAVAQDTRVCPRGRRSSFASLSSRLRFFSYPWHFLLRPFLSFSRTLPRPFLSLSFLHVLVPRRGGLSPRLEEKRPTASPLPLTFS